MATGYCIIRLCPLQPSHTCSPGYQTCTGLFVGKVEIEYLWPAREWARSLRNKSRRLWRLDTRQILFLAAWVQGQKNAVQVQRRACRGRNVFVKNNHVLKNLIVAGCAKYTPTLCDNISSALAPTDLGHFSSHYEECGVRNLNVTTAESIWRAFHWALILWS